jgi:hypothetical protein
MATHVPFAPADAIPCGYGWMKVLGPLAEAMQGVGEKAEDIAFRAVQCSPELARRVAAIPQPHLLYTVGTPEKARLSTLSVELDPEHGRSKRLRLGPVGWSCAPRPAALWPASVLY